ncbi:centractin actin-related protein of the dynactin complex [Spathaspora passalidarum NRRL Y-27907]|uniref:Centractin n=1 Tax=Spathaspora passalidarum (strain NRRL Y-27907 / 11-Y1) TaxID=619300 RepID=G3APJ3_SPAPN|nr:centractin actin-related protein of the dynactin complex [Spathaspora passalidarum NRRL Y-27907]EGW32164.1 centractin actin-related protein of the dynactin complex [Spathaspora passalidarum NRRL Y-27907]
MEGNLYNQPVVIDNGSGNIKAGFAGEDQPKTYASAIVGRPKYQKIMAGSLLMSDEPTTKEEVFVGDVAQQNRGLLKLSYPIEHGVVTNWADMEKLWYNVYTQDLKTNAEEHPLLITEAPLNPRNNRNKMCQILFESFNVPCIYVSIQAVLSLYASGRTTGVVIDSGDGVSHVVPVYEGFSLPSSIKRMDVAGRDITEHLSFNLRRMSGINLQSSSELEIVRLIKESSCFISKDPTRDEKLYRVHYRTNAPGDSSDLFASYKLPDGHNIQLGVERFRAPEILFNPQLIGNESPGIHELTSLAISKTDMDLRPILYQNIILSGGNTLLKNFGDRLLKELKQLQHQQDSSNNTIWNKDRDASYDTKMKLKIFAPPERKYSTWIGGSILAGLSTFKKMWITSQEYHENPDIIHTKCL